MPELPTKRNRLHNLRYFYLDTSKVSSHERVFMLGGIFLSIDFVS